MCFANSNSLLCAWSTVARPGISFLHAAARILLADGLEGGDEKARELGERSKVARFFVSCRPWKEENLRRQFVCENRWETRLDRHHGPRDMTTHRLAPL